MRIWKTVLAVSLAACCLNAAAKDNMSLPGDAGGVHGQAANEPSLLSAPKPNVYFVGNDKQGGGEVFLSGKRYYRRALNEKMCWVAENLPPFRQYSVTETFTSPPGGMFMAPNAITMSNHDRSRHTLMWQMNSGEQGVLSQCWGFENSDPSGQFRLELDFGTDSVQAKPFEFELQ